MVWDGAGGPLLVDAGGSTYQRLLKAGIDPQQLVGVVLTHNHADHINGLPTLIFSMSLAGRTAPLTIYGLEPTLAMVRSILAVFQLERHAVTPVWHPIEAGDSIDLGKGRTIHTTLTIHPRPCVALRFEQHAYQDHQAQQTLVYSADTAPSQAIIELARGSHTLIHEATCSYALPDVHTTPREAGEIARQAGVSRLVLVHFSPKWTMPEEQAIAEVRASGFSGVVCVGQEYQVLDFCPPA
jgi:ribonuclease Z